MLPICSAQPNWMPKNPKLMFQICQKVSCGLNGAEGFNIVSSVNNISGSDLECVRYKFREELLREDFSDLGRNDHRLCRCQVIQYGRHQLTGLPEGRVPQNR